MSGEERLFAGSTTHAIVDDTGVELDWPSEKAWLTVRDADVSVRSGAAGVLASVVRVEDGTTTAGVTPSIDPILANGAKHPIKKTQSTDDKLAVQCATGNVAEVILEPRSR